MKKLWIIAAMLSMVGCQQASEEKTEESSVEPTLANIKSIIGEPTASSKAACRLIEVGQKSCGGPERYLVYSTETVANEKQLLRLVSDYNQLSREKNKGRLSNCQFVPRPNLSLEGGMCTATTSRVDSQLR